MATAQITPHSEEDTVAADSNRTLNESTLASSSDLLSPQEKLSAALPQASSKIAKASPMRASGVTPTKKKNGTLAEKDGKTGKL
jgi:hypothetical protein